MEVSKTELF